MPSRAGIDRLMGAAQRAARELASETKVTCEDGFWLCGDGHMGRIPETIAGVNLAPGAQVRDLGVRTAPGCRGPWGLSWARVDGHGRDLDRGPSW